MRDLIKALAFSAMMSPLSVYADNVRTFERMKNEFQISLRTVSNLKERHLLQFGENEWESRYFKHNNNALNLGHKLETHQAYLEACFKSSLVTSKSKSLCKVSFKGQGCKDVGLNFDVRLGWISPLSMSEFKALSQTNCPIDGSSEETYYYLIDFSTSYIFVDKLSLTTAPGGISDYSTDEIFIWDRSRNIRVDLDRLGFNLDELKSNLSKLYSIDKLDLSGLLDDEQVNKSIIEDILNRKIAPQGLIPINGSKFKFVYKIHFGNRDYLAYYTIKSEYLDCISARDVEGIKQGLVP